MQNAITVTLPAEIKIALDDLMRNEGISADDLISRAIKEHLFLRRFRLLRERMASKANAQNVLTDQDVFDQIS